MLGLKRFKSQYHHSSVYDTSMIGGDHIWVYRSNDQRVCDHRQICHHHHVPSERCNHDVCEIAVVCLADDVNLVEIVVSLSEVVQVYVEGHNVLFLVCNYYVNMTSVSVTMGRSVTITKSLLSVVIMMSAKSRWSVLPTM